MQGRSEQFLKGGPNSKLAPLKIFFLDFSPFFRGGGPGGANGGILVKFAPLLLRHFGPRPRLLRP